MNSVLDHRDFATPLAGLPLGGKARALAELTRAGFPVPPWFVVLPEAGDEDAAGALNTVFSALENNARFAVRSSALDEDSGAHSFAGQLESFLFVPRTDVTRRLADVRASGNSERVLAYRRERGLADADRAPAVLVQRMIDAVAAGVAFSSDPVSGRRGVAVVSAVWGLGSALVNGEADADTFRVSREGEILSRDIAHKTRAHRAVENGDGVETRINSASDAGRPALADAQILAVAALARRCAQHFDGRPQDIEWAIDAAGELWLLQSRPITSLGALADPDGLPQLWDNSNIAESYNGVTTPLTFSFARRAYEEVYRQFCLLLRVPTDRVAAHADTFRRMLGLLDGRIYYNLLSWYRVLALLPGYQLNRPFMEGMMGVKEPLPPKLAAEVEKGNAPATQASRWRDGLDLANSLLGLVVNYFTLPRQIAAFYARLNHALAEQNRPPLAELRADELLAHYRELERALLTRWDAPLVNDFFAMIFHGALRKLCARWCGDEALSNDLVGGEGGIISAEPARRVRELSALAAPHSALVSALCEGDATMIRAVTRQHVNFAAEWDAYLERFGDRCLEELKLETATLADNPLPLARAVGRLARQPQSATTAASPVSRNMREGAETKAHAALAGNPLRRVVFGWVLRQARVRVGARENLRFERTRLFGRVRRIFVEIGRRFAALGLLDTPRDIFYLTLDESLGFIDGTAVTKDLHGLVALRQREFQTHREREPAPADRFETVGIVNHGNSFAGKMSADAGTNVADDSTANTLRGTGCCPGVVRGRARVVLDPRDEAAALEPGEILVAPRTDPGWIMLFASAAGLLVEHGSLLSHSAIVARELGLPAVVALPGVTRWLRTGDLVELDGAAGTVRKLVDPEKP